MPLTVRHLRSREGQAGGAMVLLALALWVLATVLVAAPVSLLLRRVDEVDVEEPVDPVELHAAIGRHPSRRAKVA